MSKHQIDTHRRKVLAGIGAVGLASAGAGLGTTAFFSDRESFANNTLQAGSLDLFVDYEASYESDGQAENMAETAAGVQDGEPAGMFYDLRDVKPGDSGHLKFCFEIVDNPAYVWACGDLSEAENGVTEPESEVDETPDEGELAENIEGRLVYCHEEDGELVEDETVATGSLAALFEALATGVPLDGDGGAGAMTPGEQSPYDQTVAVEEGDDYVTGPCVCLFWEIPTAVGNVIQSDSLTMDLDFHALQARHNDGTHNPCVDVVKVDGDGWGKLSIEDFGTSDMQAKIRSPYAGVEQFAGLGTAGGSGVVTSAENPLPDGSFVDFTLDYDGAGTLTYTVDGVTTVYDDADLGVPQDKIEITARADTAGATTTVRDVELTTNSVAGSFSELTATSSTGKRYCGWTGVPDLADGFTLEGEVMLDYDPAVTSELVAMYVHVDTSA
jgi:predicted ribosomally synthesized peptide with SipW-like signal peptide